jgi:endonuclease/exonuclease/phosphatase (EEP) superfamily protein YafD
MTRHYARLRKTALYFYIVLANTYGFITSIIIALWLLTGERFAPVRVFINLLPPLLLPAVIALPVGIVLRRWQPVALVASAFIVFLVLYGAAFLPESTISERANLTLLTYNVYVNNTDFEGVADIIRASDADFVALQEMRSEMFDFLEYTFNPVYPYIIPQDGQSVTILMSRYPIRSSETEAGTSAIIDVNGQEIIVYAVHLPVPLGDFFASNQRSHQLDVLLEQAARFDMPQILMGDFNITDATRDYRRIVQQFTDVYRQIRMGLGTTFPNWRGVNPESRGLPALIRLDYVFISSNIIPIDARVIRDGFSDHYALIAHLRLEER